MHPVVHELRLFEVGEGRAEQCGHAGDQVGHRLTARGMHMHMQGMHMHMHMSMHMHMYMCTARGHSSAHAWHTACMCTWAEWRRAW